MYIASLFATLLQIGGIASPVPPITDSIVMQSILEDLSYNAPHLTVYLGETRGPGVENLVNAGILQVTDNALVATEFGQEKASSEGWVVTDELLEVTTGRLSYVPKSYHIQQGDRKAAITYKWKYEPNLDLVDLLKLGPLSSWPASIFPNCLTSTGEVTNRVPTRTIHLYLDFENQWESDPRSEALIRGC